MFREKYVKFQFFDLNKGFGMAQVRGWCNVLKCFLF